MIAGTVLLVVTPLGAFVHPLWALVIIALAGFSINVSLTGFCVVGNILHQFGFTPMLGRTTSGNFYLMQTDRWYLERRIYMAVGINLTVASVLSMTHSAWWLTFPAFVGLAMLVFATTGFCIMANSLYWLGAEPRLAPEAGECAPIARPNASEIRA
jgi:hypothetical protein